MTADKIFEELGYIKDYDCSSEHGICYRKTGNYTESIYIGIDEECINSYIEHSPCGITFQELKAVIQCIKENYVEE